MLAATSTSSLSRAARLSAVGACPVTVDVHERADKRIGSGSSLDELFRSERLCVIKTPVRAPRANGIAERFVRTVRGECLDWLLILNRIHLEHVLRVYVEHSGARKTRGHRGNQGTVRSVEPRPTHVPAQHLDLMPQHQRLDALDVRAAATTQQ
jgi:hypothetical protein